jgi:hypothetical protein
MFNRVGISLVFHVVHDRASNRVVLQAKQVVWVL